MKRIISKQELENAVSGSLTLTDAMIKLALPENGKYRQKIRILAAEYEVDISKLNPLAKVIQRTKYEKIEKTCPVCSTKFITQKNHRDEKYCCSHNCANKFYAHPRTDEEKRKISEGVNKRLIENGYAPLQNIVKKQKFAKAFVCPVCGIEKHLVPRKNRMTCSKACLTKYEPYLDALRAAMQKRIKDGKHSGWKSRKGKMPSYPEKFFMAVLKNNNINYEREVSCGKYFIDFAIKSANIALEIDGKQHNYEDRKIKDEEKDKFLVDNGWKVYRIKWKSINSESGKIYIREQIDRFLKFYRQLA